MEEKRINYMKYIEGMENSTNMFMTKNQTGLYLALAELDISWEDKEKNREKCEKFAKAAAGQGADLLIFPEMTLTGFSMNVEKIAEKKETSTTLEFFLKLSEKYGIAAAFGMAEFIDAEEREKESKNKNRSFKKAENKCYLVSGGKILLEYAKLHPFSYGEEAKYYQGGNSLSVTKLKDIRLSSQICYDLRFPEPFQILSAQAELIFVIANWPKEREEHWNALLKARAIENQCYLAGINRCGNDPKLSYPMATSVYDPYGKRIERKWEGMGAEALDGNLYFAEIERNVVETYREEFPVKGDRRGELYDILLGKGRRQKQTAACRQGDYGRSKF
jgi:predicted amidohydrolase